MEFMASTCKQECNLKPYSSDVIICMNLFIPIHATTKNICIMPNDTKSMTLNSVTRINKSIVSKNMLNQPFAILSCELA